MLLQWGHLNYAASMRLPHCLQYCWSLRLTQRGCLNKAIFVAISRKCPFVLYSFGSSLTQTGSSRGLELLETIGNSVNHRLIFQLKLLFMHLIEVLAWLYIDNDSIYIKCLLHSNTKSIIFPFMCQEVGGESLFSISSFG